MAYSVLFGAFVPMDGAGIVAVGSASVRTSWIVNLLVAEWWLLRSRRGAQARAA